MGMWIKHFIDGTSELGTDNDIKNKEASWTKGRLKDIKSVELSNKIVLANLSVPDSEWHHFDHFVVNPELENPVSIRVLRVIQAKIQKEHIGMFVNSLVSGKFNFYFSIENEDSNNSIIITDELVDKWATVVLPERGYPQFIFSDKGKF